LQISGAALLLHDFHRLTVVQRWLLGISIVLVFALKVSLAFSTYGTNDALTWEADAEAIHQQGGLSVYRDGVVPHHAGSRFAAQQFSHPPFMIRVISAWDAFANTTGVPLRFWIRLSCAVADVVSVLLLLSLLTPTDRSASFASVFIVAVSPISVLISGFHVNTDPIMIAFLLLSLYLLKRGSPVWLAGCAMGMAINIKIVPVLFLGAVFLYIRDKKAALLFAVGAGGVVLAGSLPEIAQDPLLILTRLGSYSSTPRMWGMSRLSWALLPRELYTMYSHWMKPLMLILIVGLSVWMNRKKFTPLISQIAILAFVLLCVMPGFGVQYLAWLVPWTALVTIRQAIVFHVLSGLFLFAFYDRASRGLWYLANTFNTPVWGGSVVYLGLVVWIAICMMAVTLYRRMRENHSITPLIAQR
jgi:hypothetical protein